MLLYFVVCHCATLTHTLLFSSLCASPLLIDLLQVTSTHIRFVPRYFVRPACGPRLQDGVAVVELLSRRYQPREDDDGTFSTGSRAAVLQVESLTFSPRSQPFVDTSRGLSLKEVGFVNVGLDDYYQACGTGANGSFHNASGYRMSHVPFFAQVRIRMPVVAASPEPTLCRKWIPLLTSLYLLDCTPSMGVAPTSHSPNKRPTTHSSDRQDKISRHESDDRSCALAGAPHGVVRQ